MFTRERDREEKIAISVKENVNHQSFSEQRFLCVLDNVTIQLSAIKAYFYVFLYVRRLYDFLVFLDHGPLVSPERWRESEKGRSGHSISVKVKCQNADQISSRVQTYVRRALDMNPFASGMSHSSFHSVKLSGTIKLALSTLLPDVANP